MVSRQTLASASSGQTGNPLGKGHEPSAAAEPVVYETAALLRRQDLPRISVESAGLLISVFRCPAAREKKMPRKR